MKMIHPQKGFTLIEVIITIVITALMGVVVFTYMGNVLTRSHLPLTEVRNLSETVGVAERIVNSYENYVKDEIDWNDFKVVLATYDGVQWVPIDNIGTDFEDATFEILNVTVIRNNQHVSLLFTER
ncbi:prepilin-type N-terminal cleavage/methylation domain-containing protein [Desulfonatronum thiosulfatophilum]|uniref:Prepilin-type N-terminal cleavage/methylation domain-containing protein n=1 Tax=Desulfonatronum thiosulfatophilum TaxID=617002 RepID=A0A1G6CMX7_9BACT|nr:prepilin-type N-terminal cleavage/methylation domain-containing protein [Desulfonatronum thiosulfatophilum]SDB34253.1 prepilin-type N-terminal cleavage/methylation domain-containing protein [Desulfonatronum thiosulfatophilum]